MPTPPGTFGTFSRFSRALSAAGLLLAAVAAGPSPASAKPAAPTHSSSTKSKKAEPTAKPELSKAELAKLEVLARASTKFKCCEPRTKNIRRIADLMNNVVIQPGQSFSVNHFIGPRTEERGFVKAPSILDLEYTETVGGGISQFATTLYNALYDAGFPIHEHKPHSHYISRYPAGVEATLSWPGPDLSFKNDSDYPLVIKTTFSRDRISVKLLGKTPGRKVERKKPVELERKAPPVELIGDRTVSPKKQKVDRPGSARRSVRVMRIVDNPGGRRRTEEDVVVYLSSKRVVRVHPCKLPRGHKEYTGEECPTKSSKKKAAEKKAAEKKASEKPSPQKASEKPSGKEPRGKGPKENPSATTPAKPTAKSSKPT